MDKNLDIKSPVRIQTMRTKEPVFEDILSFDSEGLLDGECTYYYPNGNLEAIGHWDHGNKVGLWKEYNNKRLWFISYYPNRIQEGEEITFFTMG
jgi:antitoxin component YwqK of YwqJK toxin-antitoxin module